MIELKCVLYRITAAYCVLYNIALDLNMPLVDEWGTDHADFEDGNDTTECKPRSERADAQREAFYDVWETKTGS